ncbi:MAG: hypothetical protein IAC51_03490 [bacterium]|uniref:Lipocalin-like domain-containing protein n=1 Tax=Candidatus Aphodosoma intestinipullorum TaxID=2840674 RepID=A0A940IEJ1_9BACT|nr:hypothetical protein [Candidatus Aphodosoma intestinipullorum]
MKKTFRNLFLAVGAFALAAVGMTSCEPKEDEDNTQWGDYTVVGEYQGAKGEDGSNLYFITLVDNNIETTETSASGEGYMASICFYSSSANEPAEGTYNVDESLSDKTIHPGEITQMGPSGSYIIIIKDDMTDIVTLEDGTMDLKRGDDGNWEVRMNFTVTEGETTAAGEKVEINYKGAITFEDYSNPTEPEGDYSSEPATAPAEATFATATAFQQYQGMWEVQLSTSDYSVFADLYIIDSSTDINGLFGREFQITDSEANGTVLASPGAIPVDETTLQPQPSMYATGCSFDGQYITMTNVYYLVGGTVSIDESGIITIDAKSYNNHAIKATCTSAIAQGQAAAPAKVAAKPDVQIIRAHKSVK